MPDPLLGQILFQLLLILVNAFFALTEIAVISLNDTKLRRIADSGNKRAKSLIWLTKRPTRFLSTIQVGITLAGFLGSAFAADNFSDRIVQWALSIGVQMPVATLDTIAVIVITIILSFFTLVLGELVPKRIAMHNPERIAMVVAGVIKFVSLILMPLVWLLTVTTNGILRLFRIDPHAKQQEATEEEIRMMISIGEEKGNIQPAEKEMIENIFDFNNQTVEEIMTHRTDIVAIWLQDQPGIVRGIIMENTHSRFPVFSEDIDDIVGILHQRDYLINDISGSPKTLQELLRPPYMVPESIRADVLFRNMQQNHIQMAIVVDEYGGTSGLVTIEDLLEEIVGSINDEYDPLEKSIQKLDANTWRIRGSTDLGEVSEALDIPLPVEVYDTFGGYIFGQFDVIPADGARPQLEKDGLTIRVEQIEDHRVEWALVSVIEKPVEAGKSEDQ